MQPQGSNAAPPRVPPRPAAEEGGIDARERIIRTAYELFTRHGLGAVGVDRIVAEANVAKTTLYRHFHSKDELVSVVLERHHQLWLQDWFEPRTRDRDGGPAERLLSVFDSFEEWFGDADFYGCLFINSMVETRDRASAVRRASISAIADVYAVLEQLAVEAGAHNPERLARQIQLLMRGAIVAAMEGRPDDAILEARDAAQRLLEQSLPEQSLPR